MGRSHDPNDPLVRVKHVPGVRERSARVIRLKEELNLILELVVHSREALNNELSSEFAQKKLSIDKEFLSKLKDLSACYNTLSASRIQLDKSERSLEKEMTPAEEKGAVRDFILALSGYERGAFLRELIAGHRDLQPRTGNKTDWGAKVDEVEADALLGEPEFQDV